MRATYSVTKDHSYGINQTPRETLVHRPSSASRENSGQILATTVREANSYQTKLELHQQLLAELKCWKENLLLQNGKPLKIGIPQSIIQTGGTWSYQERTKHINTLELIAVKLAILTFTKGKSVTAIHLQIDNMTAVLLGKNGGNSQSRTATSSQGNMGLFASQWNSSYSRALTKQSEYSGRLAIQKSQRIERLEIEPQNIFSDCENQRNTSNRPICFPTEQSVTKIHVLASGPRQLCSRFPSALLEKPLRVCIPSILLNRKGTCQSKEGPVSSSYRYTCMANSAMVRNITRNVSSTSHNSIQSDHTVTRSSGAKAPFAGRQPATVGGMEGFRKALEGEGVSKPAATLIKNSRRSGSISNYHSAWRMWASWCCARGINPLTIY